MSVINLLSSKSIVDLKDPKVLISLLTKEVNPPNGQYGLFRPTREASKTDHTEFFPDGHGYELVSRVRALVPQKFSVEEELMHVKHVEVKSPHVGVMWKFGRGFISSGIVLVT
ncbi:hypothetical protein TNCV_4585251 [Trichonephila clavipes]|nr:hypothetical protein TNCV_4585251 [Trichonephila clavipes]